MLLRRFLSELVDRPAEIATAVADGNATSVRDLAHYFRGAALTVGAGEVAMAAGRLEQSSDDDISACVQMLTASAQAAREALARMI